MVMAVETTVTAPDQVLRTGAVSFAVSRFAKCQAFHWQIRGRSDASAVFALKFARRYCFTARVRLVES
jgi:hypothetical protein